MACLQIKDFCDKDSNHFLVKIDGYQADCLPFPSPAFTKTHNTLDFASYVPLPFYAIGDNARYKVIEQELLRISLSVDLTLENLISYIRAYTFKDMSFSALQYFLEKEADKDYSGHILTHVIPKMAVLALSLHRLITQVIFAKMPKKRGKVEIMRNCVKQVPNWTLMTDCPVGYMKASHRGSIEKDGSNMLQVDFANKFIGGGVLSHGCVQEEIRFLICPEMLISCLICEKMKSYESIRIIGAEMFSDYSGYGDSFQWVFRERDPNCPRDEYGRFLCEVVAIDALPYRSKVVQYNRGYIKREINKAYAGFSITTRQSNPDGWPIATGNWGCGAFRGDVQLKSMVQLLAASIVERKLYYFTFGDSRLAAELNEMVGILRINEISVGQLYQIIEEYSFFEARSNKSLFDHIRSKVLKDHQGANSSIEGNKKECIGNDELFSGRAATTLSNSSAYDEFDAASKKFALKMPDVV